MALFLLVLAVVPLPWVGDALFRFFWAMQRKRSCPPPVLKGCSPISRVVILIPSRGEGEALGSTLKSLVDAKEKDGVEVKPIVILDGEDPVGRRIAQEMEVRVLLKPNPGPTKAAVLRYAAQSLREEILAADAVMILDVGSLVSKDFFKELSWPPGVTAMQAYLQGRGCGPGTAASLSERLAQDVWDQGKQVYGWSVRLRGTGTIFAPATFLWLVERFRTQIEDTEATLLLQAEGERACLLPSKVVVDHKPETLTQASTQRARWLKGQVQLLLRQPGALCTLARKKPLAALAWTMGMLSRPLSLTVPARFIVGLTLAFLAWSHSFHLLVVWGTLVASSAGLEAGWLLVRHPNTLGSAVQLGWAWVLALVMLPRTKHWLLGRRKNR